MRGTRIYDIYILHTFYIYVCIVIYDVLGVCEGTVLYMMYWGCVRVPCYI